MEYDPLWEENPRIQAERARSEAIGEAKGKTEGLQTALVTFVEERFPPLRDLAEEKAKRITKPDALALVLKSIYAAPDEKAARQLLELIAA